MKRSIVIYITLGLLLITIYACTENEAGPIGDNGSSPGPVTLGEVENFPGASIVNYSLPDDLDLLYVKAVFEPQKGVIREAKASYYTNSLLLEGFGASGDYEVKLYAVDRGENESQPVTVTVSPLTSPVQLVFESLEMSKDFGGVNVGFKNDADAKIAIIVVTKDSIGDFVVADTYYTKSVEGSFSVRGFPDVEREFGAIVRDRWNNFSDTVYKKVTPLFEEQLDKEKFGIVELPTDQPAAWGRTMDRVWDGIVDGNQSIFHTAQGSGIPQWFTFDLGVTAKLSRFTLWQRMNTSLLYQHGNPREYELWGSTDPNPDGSWDESWIKLVSCESTKPSGLPSGQYSQEDWDYAARGEEYNFPLDAPPVRYVRFRLLRNWSDTDFVNFSEITFWGEVQK